MAHKLVRCVFLKIKTMKHLLIIILKIIATILGCIMMLFFYTIALILWDKKFLKLYNDTMNSIWTLDE